MYPYVSRMLLVCIRMYPYVPYVTRMLLVCYPYVLVRCFSHDPGTETLLERERPKSEKRVLLNKETGYMYPLLWTGSMDPYMRSYI